MRKIGIKRFIRENEEAADEPQLGDLGLLFSTGVLDQIVRIDLEITDFSRETAAFLRLLQEVCVQFSLQIVGLVPASGGAGPPLVTFRGMRSDVLKMLRVWYLGEDERMYEEYERYIEADGPTEFSALPDTMGRQRRYVGLDGRAIG
jgi:hypothetical protein